MFGQKFNPEFHWQTANKQINRKKILFFVLIFFLVLSFLLILKKYYFVADKNIDLEKLIPVDTKVTLSINISDIINNDNFPNFLEEEFNHYLGDNQIDHFIRNIDNNIYWLERATSSQSFLFKVKDLDLFKNDFIKEIEDTVDFENQKIYKIKGIENPFLPLTDDGLYIVYVNDYIVWVGNSLDFSKDIILKYKESSQVDYFGILKDEFTSYFSEKRNLILKVDNYNDIENSLSWIKNLSFFVQDTEDKSFLLKARATTKRLEVLFSDSLDSSQKIDGFEIQSEQSEDCLIYYSNSGLSYNNLVFSENVNLFLQNNIESLYNINFKEFLANNNLPYHFLVYPDNKFLILSQDGDKMQSIYKNILAYSKPQIRTMILPDGTRAEEYYTDSDLIGLKEYQDNDLIWYYADLSDNYNFNLVKYQEWYILTNFKDKMLDIVKNQDNFCQIVDCTNEFDVQESLNLNILDIRGEKYLPWLDLLPNSYKTLNFVNFQENGSNKAFLELIH